ncbi:MAG: phosphate transport system permease protein [Pontimonas sp.]
MSSTVTSERSGLIKSLRSDKPRYGEKVIYGFLFLTAVVSVAVTTAIVFALFQPLPSLFSEISVVEFFTATEWSPGFLKPVYGVWPIVVGTLIVVLTALLVAVPLGLLSSIYLSEYAPNGVRKTIKPVLEILEGIPTVATGLFAFFWLRPFLEYLTPWLPWGGLFSTGVAGIAVGLIIVPLIASVSDDAMRSVPRSLREGAYALGAGKMRVALKVVVPAAFSGIIAAFVLGASRAVGETMIVLLVAGAGSPSLNFNPFEGVQTMTAYIASRATGEIAVGSTVYDTIFAVGALLFIITLAMNMLAIRFVTRFREVYE